MKKWLGTGLVVLALIAVAFTARWWLEPLLTFLGANSEEIQAFADGAAPCVTGASRSTGSTTSVVGLLWRLPIAPPITDPLNSDPPGNGSPGGAGGCPPCLADRPASTPGNWTFSMHNSQCGVFHG